MRHLAATLCAVLLVAGCSSGIENRPSIGPSGTQTRVSYPSPATPTGSATPSVSPHDYSALDRGLRSNDRDIRIWRSPGGDSRRMVAHNPMGQPLVFLVTRAREGARSWYRILLPRRPNGSSAWVKEGPDVELVKLRERVELDLSEFTLLRYRDGKRVARYEVGIGQPQWPTPVGTFYVWAHVPQASPTGPYGAYAIGLSGFSDVLTEWPGGGRFAIHGTVNRWDAGRKVSHGCIRVFNPQVMKLRSLPMGTPVVITR